MKRAGGPDALLLIVAVVWGSSYLVAKDVTAMVSVLVVLALRYALTAVATLALCAGHRRPSAAGLRAGVVLGGTQAAVLVLETFGVAHTSATNAGLIISLTVVFTPVLANAWDRSWLPAPFFVAAVAAVIGVGLLVSGHGFRTPTWGDALVLAAAVVRAVHVTLLGTLTRSSPVDVFVLTAAQAVVGTVIMGAVALPRLGHAMAALPLGAWMQLAYLALACSVFAFVAQTWSVQRTSPSRASLMMGTEPVWAVVIGVAVGGERLTPIAAAGAAIIVGATFAGQRIERRHAARGSARPARVGELDSLQATVVT